ncbi:MAG: isochorismate synthase [Anaerolineae bacterium]|nr:isochorismate synthase [Anaerolineae bacterium]
MTTPGFHADAAAPAWGERPRLAAWTTALDPPDPFALLRLANGAPRLFWREPEEGLTVVGLGAAAVLRADGPLRAARLQLQMDHLFAGSVIEADSPLAVQPRLFGGLSFTPSPEPDALWADFGPACFVLPRLMVTVTAGGAWLTVGRYDDDLADSAARIQGLRDEAEAFCAALGEPPAAAVSAPRWALTPAVSREAWQRMVTQAVSQIRGGELRKVVLSRALEAAADGPFDVIAALERLDSQYPYTYRFLFEPEGESAFFGASPELLAEVHESVLTTAALAGSRRRGRTEAEDAALAAELLASPKEREEHQIVVESILARVTPYARRVEAPSEPGILRLPNIQHLHTPVRAELETHFDVLDLVAELHPTPAMGGYPARAAMTAIGELESVARGWFASPFGWIDAVGNGVFAVAIRSAIARGSLARLYAGAGIVAESVAEQEWDETGLKFRPLLNALGAENPA